VKEILVVFLAEIQIIYIFILYIFAQETSQTICPVMQQELANKIFTSIKHMTQRLTLFIALAISLGALFMINNYIINITPEPMWNPPQAKQPQYSSEEYVQEVKVKSGDTLNKILLSQGLSTKDIVAITQLAKQEPSLKKLKIGQNITFYYTPNPQEDDADTQTQVSLDHVCIQLDHINSIDFIKNENQQFIINKTSENLTKFITKYETTINSSLIATLQKIKLSNKSILKLIQAYSYQLDLQRQLKKGDKIVIIAEKFVNPKNKFSYHGRILYAQLQSKGNDYKIYSFSPSGKDDDYHFFSENGQNVRSSLLKTPIEVVKISSHFGYRDKHPVLGFGAMHKGVDFAAAPGTPIYAAGDGVIQFIGWKSGYGKFIIIKHSNGISTAYAHASKFAKNLKTGSSIRQGQVIAYVGTTGNTTGPHLHYEIRVNGVQVNPMKFKTTPGAQLSGTKLHKFNELKARVQKLNTRMKENQSLEESEAAFNV